MFPLNKRELIRGARAHQLAGLGIACDYVGDHDILFAPFDGVTEIAYPWAWYLLGHGPGGRWLRLLRADGWHFEFAHLVDGSTVTGKVTVGQKIAMTDNTGSLTTGPHLHVQAFNPQGQRVDPETIDWETNALPDIRTLFLKVWGRPGATGDIAYFAKRLEDHTITDNADLVSKMQYWHGVVYPLGIFNPLGDIKWQKEKTKVLG